jgi:hypothetical protein
MTFTRFRRSKFNACKTTSGGITYDSKMEAAYADQLEWRKRAGEITKIERQVRIPLIVNGVLICTYIADFRVTLTNGRRQYHEVKGFMTKDAALKMKLVNALKDQIDPGAEWIIVKK